MSRLTMKTNCAECSTPPAAQGCQTVLEGRCLDLELTLGETFSHLLLVTDSRFAPQTLIGYTPGTAGSASLQLSSPDHGYTTEDCIYVHGICAGQPGETTLPGYYTVVAVNANTILVAEAIAGTEVVTYAPTNPMLCGGSTSLPGVVKLLDLTAATVTMEIFNRGGQYIEYSNQKVQTFAQSPDIRVCGRSLVCAGDCVSIPAVGVEDAQVKSVAKPRGQNYTIITLRDQTPNASSECAALSGSTGRLTPVQVDMSRAACGTLVFRLDPESSVDTINSVTYLGTRDLVNTGCEEDYKGSTGCENRFVIGAYNIKVRAVNPATSTVETTVIQTGRIVGLEVGLGCM